MGCLGDILILPSEFFVLWLCHFLRVWSVPGIEDILLIVCPCIHSFIQLTNICLAWHCARL